MPISTDDVDPEQIARPQPWSIDRIKKFVLFIGPCCSVFDYSTYLVMWFVFKATTPGQASLFQTGCFVESLLTQTLIIQVILTTLSAAQWVGAVVVVGAVRAMVRTEQVAEVPGPRAAIQAQG